MPLVYTVSQLLQMSDGATAEAIKGKVKKVWPSITRNGTYGEWKMQKLILVDGNDEIECVLKNSPEDIQPAVQGKMFYAEAGKDGKGKLKGFERKENRWTNDKGDHVTQQIWVWEGAQTSFEGSTPQAHSQPSNRQQSNGRANGNGASHSRTNGNGAANGQAPRQTPSEGRIEDKKTARQQQLDVMTEFDKRVGRASSAFGRCFDAAIQLTEKLNIRYPEMGWGHVSIEMIEKMASCILVQATWDNKPANTEFFPLKDFQSVKGTNQPAPNQPPPQRQQEPDPAPDHEDVGFPTE